MKKMNYRVFVVVVLAGTIMTSVAAFSQGGAVSAPTRWTRAEFKKGYVVFEHNPMAKLAASLARARPIQGRAKMSFRPKV